MVPAQAKQAAPSSGRLVSISKKQEARDVAVEQITALLKQSRMTNAQVAGALGINPSTAFTYLRHMERVLRTARKSGELERPNGAALWELGEDPALPTAEELEDAACAPRRRVVPARQVGMWRDRLDVALFGPARAQGAAA